MAAPGCNRLSCPRRTPGRDSVSKTWHWPAVLRCQPGEEGGQSWGGPEANPSSACTWGTLGQLAQELKQPPPRLRPANTAAPGFSARRGTPRTSLPNPCPIGCPRRGLLAQAEGGTGHGHSSYARVAEGPLGWRKGPSGVGRTPTMEWDPLSGGRYSRMGDWLLPLCPTERL